MKNNGENLLLGHVGRGPRGAFWVERTQKGGEMKTEKRTIDIEELETILKDLRSARLEEVELVLHRAENGPSKLEINDEKGNLHLSVRF